MSTSRIARLAVVVLFAALWTSCSCVQELSLKNTVSADDLRQAQEQAGGKGSASVELSLKFRDCCPSSEQRQLLLSVQRSLAKLYEELVAGRVSLQDYNAKAEASRIAVEQVARVCGTRSDSDAAWSALAATDEELREALSSARAR